MRSPDRLAILLCALPWLPLAMAAPEPPAERWTLSAFTQPLGGGPETGPAAAAGGGGLVVCEDGQGNRFIAGEHWIDIIQPDGLRRHIAGSGRPGYHEGPGESAEFRLGHGGYLGAFDMACGDDQVFVFDDGNNRIRRLYRTDEGWFTETWVGGGNVRLRPGESTGPRDFLLPSAVGIAVDGEGQLWLGSYHAAYRVSSDGSRITRIVDWPESTAHRPGKPPTLHIVHGGTDAAGRVYFMSRSPDVVIRVEDRRATHVAGLVVAKRKPLELGDATPLQAYINTPTGMAMDLHTPALYLSGGDEYDIRRIPFDTGTFTATLMRNGRWDHASVHPNRSRGPALFEPGIEGRLRPQGKLTVFMNCHLLGNDRQGGLYGLLYPWRGMTQYHAGVGLLPTRIYRLHRATESSP